MIKLEKKEIIPLSLIGLELSVVLFSFSLFKHPHTFNKHPNNPKFSKSSEVIYPNVRKAKKNECVNQNSKMDKIQDFIAPDHVLEYKIDRKKTDLRFSTDNTELQKILKRKNALTIKEQTDKNISFCVGTSVSNFWLSRLPFFNNVTEGELNTLGLLSKSKIKK